MGCTGFNWGWKLSVSCACLVHRLLGFDTLVWGLTALVGNLAPVGMHSQRGHAETAAETRCSGFQAWKILGFKLCELSSEGRGSACTRHPKALQA